MKTTYLLLLSTTLTFTFGTEPFADAAEGEVSTPSLSLGEVTRAVLANNPAIKEALQKWNAANARVPQAAAWDDPKISGESRVRRYVSVPPNAFMDQIVSVEQVVPITGKNLARARIATAEALSVYEQVRRQQLDTITAARASFFRLANAYEQLDINHKN